MKVLPFPSSLDAANGDPSSPASGKAPDRSRPARRRRSRLAAALDAHLAASPEVGSHGPDPRVEAMARIFGLTALGVVVRRAGLAGRCVSLVAVPARVWADRTRRAAVLRLKPLGCRFGDRVLVVQERRLICQPQLGNARLVAGCADVAMPAGDRFAVVGSLIDEPGAPLGDLAGLVRGPTSDPVGAVLSLVAQGVVKVDTGRPIGPATQAWLHDRDRSA